MKLSKIFDRLRSRALAFIHDLLMIPVAWVAAFFLRFNLGPIPDQNLSQALEVLPAVILIQGAAFWYFGLYRGVWRFASIPDFVRIFKAIVVGVSLIAVAIFFLTRMQDVPRSVFPLYAVMLAMLLGGPRMPRES